MSVVNLWCDYCSRTSQIIIVVDVFNESLEMYCCEDDEVSYYATEEWKKNFLNHFLE